MARQKVVVEFGADARQFNREMGAIKKDMRAFGKFALAGLGAAAAGYLKLLKSATEYGDGIDKASARTGIGVEALQRLQFAAELSGTSVEGLEKGVKRMTSVVMDADDGLTESIRAMDRLGVSMDDVKGKTPEDQLMIFMDALAGVENMGERAALASDVFGKAGTQLLPILRDGSKGFRELLGEADKVNGVLSQDLVSGAAKLQDSMGRVGLAIKALAFREVLSDADGFADKLSELSVQIAEFAETDDYQQIIDNTRALAAEFRIIAETVTTVIRGLVRFGEWMAEGEGQQFIDALERRLPNFEAVQEDTRQLSIGRGQFGEAGESDISKMREDIRKLRTEGMPVKPVGAVI
jgi:hypothetical protein